MQIMVALFIQAILSDSAHRVSCTETCVLVCHLQI